MTVCPRCDAHFDVVRPEPNPPEAIEAAARALADKLHWFDDDERARELAVAALTAAAAVSRPVPAPEPEDALEDALLLSFWECGHGTQPDSLDPDCPACAARARMIEATSPDPVVPVDDEPRNPYRTLHARMSPPGAAWDEGFAAGRAAATPDPPTDERRPWPIAPDTVMPPRRQPVRWGSRADDPPTEIHDDPGKTKAYLAGLAAGRTEAAAASPDERLREAVAALPQYVITIQDREGYTYERGCEGQPMNYTGVMLADVEALVGKLKDGATTARETTNELKDAAADRDKEEDER